MYSAMSQMNLQRCWKWIKNNGNVPFSSAELGPGFDGFSCCFSHTHNGDVTVIISA